MPLRKHGPAAELLDQKVQGRNLIVLADEEGGLVGIALTEQIKRCEAESPCDERIAICGPQLGILRQAVDQHISRRVGRTVKLVADPIRAVAEEGIAAIPRAIWCRSILGQNVLNPLS
ncbi:hypothetical protein ACSHT2_09900 [Bradyrhizobium sp. PUT101]|uniref:hypothetical protein n=1 Tax=Bradyrhizobium sp. PUT101 TaxID=3447427 RepID=UPI003F86E562